MSAKNLAAATKKPAAMEVDDEEEREEANAIAQIQKTKHTRKCQDLLFLMLYVVFWCGMIAIFVIGLWKGHPRSLIYGTDHDGVACGVDANKGNNKIVYPRLQEDFVLNLGKSPLDYKFFGVCVNSCPRAGEYVCTRAAYAALFLDHPDSWKTAPKSHIEDCFDKKKSDPYNLQYCVDVRDGCWFQSINTTNLLFRCLPVYGRVGTVKYTCVYPNNVANASDPSCITIDQLVKDSLTKPAQPNFVFDKLNQAHALFGRYVGDLQETWKVIATCGIVLSVIFGFVWITFAKWCTGLVVWLTVIATVLGTFGITLFFYVKAGLFDVARFEKWQDKIGTSQEIPSVFSASDDNQTKFKYAAYVFTGVSILVLLLVVAIRSKINFAVDILQEAAKCLKKIPQLVFFPIVTVVFLLILYIYWIAVAVLVVSAGEIQSANLTDALNSRMKEANFSTIPLESVRNITTSFKDFESIDVTNYLLIYHFFGLLWTSQFIHALSLCTIAGAVAYYYRYREDPRGIPSGPVCRSFYNTMRYHLGSLAFGSLLVAILKFIRSCLAYVKTRLAELAGEKGGLVKCLIRIVECFLSCFERCVKFVTKNAYIMIAVDGTSFCTATRRAMSLIIANITEVAVVNVISEFMLFLGKVFVTCACGMVAFVYIDLNPDFDAGGVNEITGSWLTVLLTMIFAYFIASGFFNVYDMAIDTILLCFCKDRDENPSGLLGSPTGELKVLMEGVRPKHRRAEIRRQGRR